MAGIKDIAKITGLSVATISRVFNDSPLVSQKTKTKVLQTARELDYQPNMMAAALRSGKSKIIGVIVPEVNNNFFSSIINGIEQKVSDLGYNIIISQSHESEKNESAALQSFAQLNTDGVLMSLSKETTDFSQIRKLIRGKIPIVFFDRAPEIEQVNSVVLDDYQGAFLATQHLIDQGCKHIVHIAGDVNVSIFNERRLGFSGAMKKNGITCNKKNIIELYWNIQADKTLLKEYLAQNKSTDGIFVFGDEGCLYVMNILKELGVDIPGQIKLIGFGNADYSAFVNPAISTIDQKCAEMGLWAAEILLKNLGSDQATFSKRVLSPELIVRDSTRK
ncbi:LacI family DNA-binding transcriptional regulator [Spongiimicrobium sp. 3-5]|uniref:LacI family DNA-binding transcriptional regulator n=1 Tax=Spongiimicrobium sp. 3-5 TaxID=3332596 RepID=UPI0039806DDC